MKASILDLRYKMKDILKALERNEQVIITHRGKEKGVILAKQPEAKKSITEHPFFGMRKEDKSQSVTQIMDELRGNRYNDLQAMQNILNRSKNLI